MLNSSEPYTTLEVLGQGQFPRLSFDMRECVLPPVPLGMRSCATFRIVNNGYDNLELKYRCGHVTVSLPRQDVGTRPLLACLFAGLETILWTQ